VRAPEMPPGIRQMGRPRSAQSSPPPLTFAQRLARAQADARQLQFCSQIRCRRGTLRRSGVRSADFTARSEGAAATGAASAAAPSAARSSGQRGGPATSVTVANALSRVIVGPVGFPGSPACATHSRTQRHATTGRRPERHATIMPAVAPSPREFDRVRLHPMDAAKTTCCRMRLCGACLSRPSTMRPSRSRRAFGMSPLAVGEEASGEAEEERGGSAGRQDPARAAAVAGLAGSPWVLWTPVSELIRHCARPLRSRWHRSRRCQRRRIASRSRSV